MTVALQPARSRLRAIDPARASLQSQVIEALNQRIAGAYLLEARLAADEHAPAWIILDASGAGGVWIAPLLADGAIPPLTDGGGRPDVALAAVALGTIEPIVAAVELAIGSALRAIEVVASARNDAVLLAIEAWRDGSCVHRALVSLAPDMRVAPASRLPPRAAATIAFAPAWIAAIAGPSLSGARVMAMSVDDLLLTGTTGNVARFTPPGRTTALTARLDVQQGAMIVIDETEATPRVVAEAVPQSDAAEIRVPTTIEFDSGGLTMDRLASLGVGSVVPVPAAADGVLPVRVLASGTRVASGELVAVGDGYGVLITALYPRPAAEG